MSIGITTGMGKFLKINTKPAADLNPHRMSWRLLGQ
jgi:hypothetical protein